MRTLFHSLAAAILAVGLTLSPAAAGPFDTTAAPIEQYIGQQEGVPDFNFTKAEFGNSEWGAVAHLLVESGVYLVNGATVVYNAATDAVDVYVSVGTYSEAKEAKQRTGEAAYFDCGFLMTYGEIVMHAGKPHCIPGSAVGTASTSPQSVYSHTIGAVARSCTFETNDGNGDPSGHQHSC
jgi:hypothetical protein